jgi:hypothetical protein
MLFPTTPGFGAIQLGLGIVGFVGAACGPLGNLVFLIGGEKEVAVRADGEVLAICFLQPTVGATLAVEGIKVVDVKLGRREGTGEVTG